MDGDEQKRKMSPQFESRLESLPPEAKVRAVLMLESGLVQGGRNRRLSGKERQQRIKQVLDITEPLLVEIDAILKRHRGRRLSPKVNALGSVPVETTGAGLRELAESDKVRAILEDQNISPLSPHRQM